MPGAATAAGEGALAGATLGLSDAAIAGLGGEEARPGATAIVVLENFAHVVATVIDRTAVRTVLVTSLGDMLDFPMRHVVNFVVRHVRKMVPSWRIAPQYPSTNCNQTTGPSGRWTFQAPRARRYFDGGRLW